MTTYNTYQEAKIANPEGEVYSDGSMFFTLPVKTFMYDSAKCNPADYCMTVEKFLADGHKFVKGDWYIENDDSANKIDPDDVEIMNEKSKHDATIYILRAAALEEKKPRTKVEYVKVTDSIFDLRPDFEAGELFSKVNHARDYSTISNTQTLAQALHQSCCYRRIETPMTWKEELYDYLDSSCEMSDDFDGSFTIEIEGRPLEFNLNDDEFVDMCKLVASLNSVN